MQTIPQATVKLKSNTCKLKEEQILKSLENIYNAAKDVGILRDVLSICIVKGMSKNLYRFIIKYLIKYNILFPHKANNITVYQWNPQRAVPNEVMAEQIHNDFTKYYAKWANKSRAAKKKVKEEVSNLASMGNVKNIGIANEEFASARKAEQNDNSADNKAFIAKLASKGFIDPRNIGIDVSKLNKPRILNALSDNDLLDEIMKRGYHGDLKIIKTQTYHL